MAGKVGVDSTPSSEFHEDEECAKWFDDQVNDSHSCTKSEVAALISTIAVSRHG